MEIARCWGAFQVDGQREWRGPPRWSTRWPTIEQLVPLEAPISRATFRVQDLELHRPTRGTVPVPNRRHRAALPDHVPSEPDPAGSHQVETQPAGLAQRGGQPRPDRARFHHHQQRPRPPGNRCKPAQPVTDTHPRDSRILGIRQVHDQQVHGPCGEQRGGQLERLIEIDWREHHEPFRAYAASNRLHGVEGTSEVQPGDDRSCSLRLSGYPQRQRGLS